VAAASIRGRILGAFGLSVATSGGALLYSLVQLRGIGQGLAVLDDGYLPIARVSAELGALARQMDQDHERIAREEGQPSPGQRRLLQRQPRRGPAGGAGPGGGGPVRGAR
jgi:hypothetical protein